MNSELAILLDTRRCPTTLFIHAQTSTSSRDARHWPGLQPLVAGPLVPSNPGEAVRC